MTPFLEKKRPSLFSPSKYAHGTNTITEKSISPPFRREDCFSDSAIGKES
jgi:hypothetical protein